MKDALRPPGYELFFAPLAVVLTPNDFENIQFAYFSSKYGHLLQLREDGTPYFDHPKAAAWIYIDELGGRNVRAIIDQLLHDMSENAYLLSPYRLGLNFGIDIALDVRALTKLPPGKESTTEYLGRIMTRGPQAILAKLCDRLHNLRTMEVCTLEKQTRQVRETLDYHCPLLIPALREHGGEWAAHANALAVKIAAAIQALVPAP